MTRGLHASSWNDDVQTGVCLPWHQEGWRQVRKIVSFLPQPSEQGSGSQVPLESPFHGRATLSHFTGGKTKDWRAGEEGSLPRWATHQLLLLLLEPLLLMKPLLFSQPHLRLPEPHFHLLQSLLFPWLISQVLGFSF